MKKLMADVEIKGISTLFHNKLNPGVVEEGFKETKVHNKGGVKKETPLQAATRVAFKNKKGYFHPAIHIKSCVCSAASEFIFKDKRTWKGVMRSGFEILPIEVQLKGKAVLDGRPEWVGGMHKVPMMRYRMTFPNWNMKFRVEVIDDRIPLEKVKEYLELGGLRYGIGDLRKRGMGKFEVIKFKEIKQ